MGGNKPIIEKGKLVIRTHSGERKFRFEHTELDGVTNMWSSPARN